MGEMGMKMFCHAGVWNSALGYGGEEVIVVME